MSVAVAAGVPSRETMGRAMNVAADVAYLREKSRSLPQARGEDPARSITVAERLQKLAADLDAKADELERRGQSG
jgi:hypothetical protein